MKIFSCHSNLQLEKCLYNLFLVVNFIMSHIFKNEFSLKNLIKKTPKMKFTQKLLIPLASKKTLLMLIAERVFCLRF